MLGRTERSPWLSETMPCQYGYLCPLQNYHDFKSVGSAMTITRRDLLLYLDDVGVTWPALETLSLQRAP
jgi:hypothetical protein